MYVTRITCQLSNGDGTIASMVKNRNSTGNINTHVSKWWVDLKGEDTHFRDIPRFGDNLA